MASDPYDPFKFYTRSRDSKGEHFSVRFNEPGDLAYQISEIVQSRRIPEYKTHQDFHRDADYHRACFLRDEFKIHSLEKPLYVYRLLAEEEQRQTQVRASRELVDLLRKRLGEAQSAHDKQDAVDAIMLATDILDEPFRGELRGMIGV